MSNHTIGSEQRWITHKFTISPPLVNRQFPDLCSVSATDAQGKTLQVGILMWQGEQAQVTLDRRLMEVVRTAWHQDNSKVPSSGVLRPVKRSTPPLP